MKKKKTKLPNISVTTLTNGYALTFDGMRQHNGYMYFTPEDLLKGFMIHIGCGKTDQLDMSNVDDFLDAVLAYKDKDDCIEEIHRLQSKIEIAQRSRNYMARRLIFSRGQLVDLVKDIDRLAFEYKNFQSVSIELRKAIKKFSTTKPLTLKDLGVTSDDIKDLEADETEEDNV
jgi:hypothetical protein